MQLTLESTAAVSTYAGRGSASRWDSYGEAETNVKTTLAERGLVLILGLAFAPFALMVAVVSLVGIGLIHANRWVRSFGRGGDAQFGRIRVNLEPIRTRSAESGLSGRARL